MKCITIKHISFVGFNNESLVIPEGSTIFVDYIQCVAFWNDVHFYISKDEYQVLN